MKFGSVCSGIEAASVAWNPLGWKAQWLSEIEPFPCSLLAHHYPDTPNLGDMTKYNDWPTDDKHAIDLLCGGTPCQSFSVAGLRKGLDDPRGNLMLTFGAIAAKYRPQWLVWENVPGVLSSNGGRDFGSFLGMLGQLGYGFAYRVLDAQYFGVAQRRRRVFVVGCFGDWRSAAAVLFERHSLQGHLAPRRQAGQTITPTIRAGAANGGAGHGARSGDSKDELIVPVEIVETLCIATGQAGAEICAEMAPTLNCNHEAPYAMYQTAHTLRGEGFDASEDGTGRGTPLVPVGLTIYGTDKTVRVMSYTDVAGSLRTKPPGSVENSSSTAVLHPVQPLPFDTTQLTSKANYSNPKAGDPCHPLAAQAHVPCIAFPERMSGTQCASTENLAPSMGALNPTAVAVSLRGHEGGATAELGDEVGNCLRASGGGGDKAHVLAYSTKLHNTTSNNAGKIFEERTACLDANSPPPALLTAMQVRRLTPRECEALQGFPRDYTAVPGKRRGINPDKLDRDYIKYLMRGGTMTFDECCRIAADGPRYKALGNSWAVPNVRWIGLRIEAVMEAA